MDSNYVSAMSTGNIWGIKIRLIISAIVIAVKYNEDYYYNNEFYSKVGGITCKELNKLEVEMLSLIEFNLHVETEIYERYAMDLCPQSAEEGKLNLKKNVETDTKAAHVLPQVTSQSSLETIPSSTDLASDEASH